MTEQQVPKLAAALVEHQGRFSEFSTEDAQWVIQKTEDAIALFVSAVKNRASSVAQAVKKLLAFVMSVNIPALPAFTAADHFKEDTRGAVRIWSLGWNFKKKFLGKIEDVTECVDLKVHKLLEKSHDTEIMTELGDAYEITLGQLFHLLSKQGKGEAGPLLVNGWTNIAYIQDIDGVFWVVHAIWYAGYGGWNVAASSLEYPSRWYGGYQFLSR